MAAPEMDKIFKTALTDTSATQQEEAGIVRWEGGAAYRYVQAASAISQYDTVMYSGTTGYIVASTSATGNEVVLGAAQVAIAANYWGWILVYGKGTVKVVAATAAGSPLADSTTAGTLAAAAATDTVNASGVALETGVAAGSAVFLQCL